MNKTIDSTHPAAGSAVWPRGLLVILLLSLCLGAAPVLAAGGAEYQCGGSLANSYGPFDYTNPVDVRDKLPIVEQHHFDRGVEQLRGHAKAGGKDMLGGDLDYTLRAFPNHHRALDTLGRFELQTGKVPAPGARHSAACYFERARRFAPHDPMVPMVFGIFLARSAQHEAALEQYLLALESLPESSELHYNLGLLYTSMQRYDEANEHAHKAYDLGYPLPGLARKLARLGQWQERVPDE